MEPALARAPGDEVRGEPGPSALDQAALDATMRERLPDRAAARPPALFERRPRVGMVFGGGGVLGNAYLAAAVAALADVTGFEPRTATALVGTSAGSVHAALYGAGMPATFGLWRARGGRLPDDFVPRGDRFDAWTAQDHPPDEGEAATLREIFTPARALPRIGPAAPGLVLRALLRPWAYRPEVTLAALLPEGVLTTAAIGTALRRVLTAGWATHPRTWVTAVNLRTGERTVFGQPGAPRADLDRAVRASCAIPGLYRPVRIGRDRFVDGGMHSPSNADLLAPLDLDLAIVVNPMSSLEGRASTGFVDRYLSPLRHLAGRHLDAELRLLEAADVPTLVIQPSVRDLAAFSRNLMDPRPRHAVIASALQTTAEALQGDDAAPAVRLLRAAAQTAHAVLGPG